MSLARVSPSDQGWQIQAQHSIEPESDETVLETYTHRYHTSLPPGQPGPARTSHPEETAPPAVGPEAWAARVRRLGVDAPRESETWRAALLLVASQELGHNVDRLARKTGAPRPFAAKCARRLVDNGIWAGGEVVALWTHDPTAREAFRRDVAVAEGKMLRRTAKDGALEWELAGRWTKNFEREDKDLSASYSDAPPRSDAPVPLASQIVRGKRPPAVKPVPDKADPVAAALEDVESIRPERTKVPPAAPKPETKTPTNDAPSLEEVFSNAVWLR